MRNTKTAAQTVAHRGGLACDMPPQATCNGQQSVTDVLNEALGSARQVGLKIDALFAAIDGGCPVGDCDKPEDCHSPIEQAAHRLREMLAAHENRLDAALVRLR